MRSLTFKCKKYGAVRKTYSNKKLSCNPACEKCEYYGVSCCGVRVKEKKFL